MTPLLSQKSCDPFGGRLQPDGSWENTVPCLLSSGIALTTVTGKLEPGLEQLMFISLLLSWLTTLTAVRSVANNTLVSQQGSNEHSGLQPAVPRLMLCLNYQFPDFKLCFHLKMAFTALLQWWPSLDVIQI